MKGVILAAGLGTRMRPLTNRRPKPLVPVLDRPMIEHIILGAADAGVTELLIVVGYRGEMIREALGDGERFGLAIEYATQAHPGGTGDAALLAEEFVAGEPFFLSWGDIIVSRHNYARLRQVWEEERPDLVLSVNVVPDPYEGAAVYVEDGLVVRIIEKPPRGASTTNYNNAGIFVLPAGILRVTREIPLSKRGERELPDAIQRLLAAGARVRALPIEGCWSDVARPAGVIRLNTDLLTEVEGPPEAVESPTATRAASATAQAPYVLGARASVGERTRLGPAAYVLEGAAIGADCTLANCLVLPNARIGDGSVLEWAVVEGSMEAEAGTRLTGTPDEPAYLVPEEET